MPYREVTMLETKELLRLWLDGMAIKTIAGWEGILCGHSAIYAGLAQVLNEVYGRTVLSLGTVK